MVDVISAISVCLVVIAFIALLLFIRKLDVEIERTICQSQRKDAMVSLSRKTIPFKDISLTKTKDSLKLSLNTSATFSLSYNCYVALHELKKFLTSQQKNNPKTLQDTVTLLSLWTSNPTRHTAGTAEECNITNEFNLNDIPSNIFEQINKLFAGEKEDIIAPFAIYMQLENLDELQHNDIVSLLVVFTASESKLEIQDYFMETLSGQTYPLKKLYLSGVQGTGNVESFPLNELCVVCHSNPVTRVSLPCRHASVCKSCYQQLDQLCPVCRQVVTSSFPIVDESFLPQTEEESRQSVSSDIHRMGWWQFLKSVWNSG